MVESLVILMANKQLIYAHAYKHYETLMLIFVRLSTFYLKHPSQIIPVHLAEVTVNLGRPKCLAYMMTFSKKVHPDSFLSFFLCWWGGDSVHKYPLSTVWHPRNIVKVWLTLKYQNIAVSRNSVCGEMVFQLYVLFFQNDTFDKYWELDQLQARTEPNSRFGCNERKTFAQNCIRKRFRYSTPRVVSRGRRDHITHLEPHLLCQHVYHERV